MANVNLSGMTVEGLMDLRKRVDKTLIERRAEIERQLAALAGGRRVVRGGGSALKGTKVLSNTACEGNKVSVERRLNSPIY
jgi:hypothetical protein